MTRSFKVGISAPSIAKDGGLSTQFLMADGSVSAGSSGPLTQTALSTGFLIAGGTISKTLQINNTIAFSGTDSTTFTFPGTSGTVATLNNANMFSTDQTISGNLTADSIIKLGGTSSQFLKADGSVDSSTYLTTTGIAAIKSGPTTLNTYTAFSQIPYGGQKLDPGQNKFYLAPYGFFSAGDLAIFNAAFPVGSVVTATDATQTGTFTITQAATINGGGYIIADNITTSAPSTIFFSGATTLVGGASTAGKYLTNNGTTSSWGTIPTYNTLFDIIPLDEISNEINGQTSRFLPKYQGQQVTINNPLRLLVTINGIIQTVGFTDNTWQSFLPKDGFVVDYDGYIAFSEVLPLGSSFQGRLMAGSETTSRTTTYPFRASDILLGE